SSYCKVDFISEDRQDKIVTYYYGALLKINKRLKEINISAQGATQKRYVLNYVTNGISQISLLNSVIEYGKDGRALPQISFSYQQPLSGNNFELSGQWLTNTTYSYENGFEGQIGYVPPSINMAILDLDGDNLPDLIGCSLKGRSPVSKYDWIVYFNTGNSFSPQENKWLDAEKSYYSFSYGGLTYYESISLDRNATLADMNKDGLPDLVYSKKAGVVSWNYVSKHVYDIVVRYNTGSGFSDTETKLFDHSQAYYYDDRVFFQIKVGDTAMLADMNGDSLPDLVYNKLRGWESWGNSSYSVHDWTVRLNTGDGFSNEEKTWLSYDKAYFKYELVTNNLTSHIFERITVNHNAMLIDMNNDGLLDLVFNDFANQVTLTGPPVWLSMASYNWKVRYNTGTNFSDGVTTLYESAPVYFYKNKHETKAISVKIGYNGTMADINNDGLPDFIFNDYREDNPDYPTVTWKMCYNLGNKFGSSVDLMNSLGYYLSDNRTYLNVTTYNSHFIDVNKDGVVDFVYPQFIEWINNTQKSNLIVYKNKGLIYTDLMTNQTSIFGGKTKITYEPSSNFNNNGDDNKNDLPFVIPVAKSISKNPGIGDSGTTSYNYEGGCYDILKRDFRGFRHVQATDPLGYVSHTYFHQVDSKLGKIEHQENSIAKTLNTYQDDTSTPYFTPLIQMDEYTNSKCARTQFAYDAYGNITKTSYFGDIEASGEEKSILTDYAINSSSWLVNLPSRERLFANADGSGSFLSETQYFYDNNANYTDTPTKGDLTKVKRYLNTKNDYISTASTYDAYGNEVTKTDANGNTTNIEYDFTYHLFPVTITNPKSHIEKISYYSPSDNKGLFGQIKSKTDPNNNETIFEYDGLGRKTKIIGPYDLSSAYGSESYEYGINGPGANYILSRTTEENNTSNHFIKIDLLDGFERIIQSAKESEDTNIYSYITTNYNSRGETSKISLPYFKDGGLRISYLTPDGSVKWTQYSYDAIGRITQITKADGGAINNSYNGWITTVMDENGHQKTLIKDAYERLISVKEKNKSEEYTTSYNYDALDNLSLITDHLGNKFEFFYDSLRQRIKMVDPDLGTWTYDYDNNGNLIKTNDANGETINFSYDTLNRIISKDYANQSGVEVKYNYDEATSNNSIGRRSSMQDLSGSSRWAYDKEGRIIKLEKTIDTNTYKLEWSYDAMDRIKSILFPNLKKVDFRYNNAGLTESIDGFILNTDCNAAYQPTMITFSNPLTARFDYYPENNRLKSLLTGSLQDLRYEYDKVGNVTKITDAVRSYTKNYAYDDLDRLISGDSNTYEYNAIGNITKVNGIAQTYSSSKIHALINDGTNNYSYDSCGNMVAGAGRNIGYDSENRPISISKSGITTQFFYDGDGKRVKKTVANASSVTTTVYIEDLYEKEITE
ncbi:MAG: hypothetical protein HZA27_02155, partial [Candidatus Omnitrophica bacterium]|nr:hypothetical protein [Candidatus Omnitrophota bacterium]